MKNKVTGQNKFASCEDINKRAIVRTICAINVSVTNTNIEMAIKDIITCIDNNKAGANAGTNNNNNGNVAFNHIVNNDVDQEDIQEVVMVKDVDVSGSIFDNKEGIKVVTNECDIIGDNYDNKDGAEDVFKNDKGVSDNGLGVFQDKSINAVLFDIAIMESAMDENYIDNSIHKKWPNEEAVLNKTIVGKHEFDKRTFGDVAVGKDTNEDNMKGVIDKESNKMGAIDNNGDSIKSNMDNKKHNNIVAIKDEEDKEANNINKVDIVHNDNGNEDTLINNNGNKLVGIDNGEVYVDGGTVNDEDMTERIRYKDNKNVC